MSFWKEYLEYNPEARWQLLDLADRAYRIGFPMMSDDEYDEILGDEEPTLSDYMDDDLEMAHVVPMLSQKKTYSASEVVKDPKFTRSVSSLKLDGFAVSLHYHNGVLLRAMTRGDGSRGHIITNHVLAGVVNVPYILPFNSDMCEGDVIVRGEMVIDKKFSDRTHTARSICVGAFGRKDYVKVVALEPHFFAYDMIGAGCVLYSEVLKKLESAFDVVPYRVSNGSSELSMSILELTEEREGWVYDCDGIVIRMNDNYRFKDQGATRHHPKGSIALKFNTDTADTIVTDIEWSVGEKTGKMTPIVHIEPVELGGCTISKLNGGKIGEGLQKGDRICITRKGGVIPVILGKL